MLAVRAPCSREEDEEYSLKKEEKDEFRSYECSYPLYELISVRSTSHVLVQFTFKRKRSNKKKTKLSYHLIKQMSRQPGLKMDMGNGVFWSHVIDRLGKIQDFTERGEIRTAE